jgi:SAM-dependent methyltransferase
MLKIIHKIHWFASSQMGLDFLKLLKFPLGIPFFIRDYFIFMSKYKGKIKITPCLNDRFDNCCGGMNEYFWQDLLIARKIFSEKPKKHVDIGSKVDGFVSNVASFRELEVFDIRPLQDDIENVIFKRVDVLVSDSLPQNYCDSVSCLHALEHFGLGRYGDNVDIDRYKIGINNISKLLKKNGIFYLSVPIGIERVEFNANMVFNPFSIIDEARKCNLAVEDIYIVKDSKKEIKIGFNEKVLRKLSKEDYTLAIFVFRKEGIK